MRGKREAGGREEAGLPQGTEKEELHVTGSPIGSGMTKNKKGSPKSDSESGRSMVETLGVLAIMGLLAIGGVIGYRWAMDKYNANEIINEVKKRAIVASQQRIQNRQIDLKEFHPTTDRDLIQNRYLVSVSNEYNNNLGFFSISLDSIPENVCNALLNMDWTLPVEIKIGDVIVTDNTKCPTETDTSILFAFHNLLNPNAIPTDPACENITCPVGTTCSKGKCLCQSGQPVCGDVCCTQTEQCTEIGEVSQCFEPEGVCFHNEDCKDENGEYDPSKYCHFSTWMHNCMPGPGECKDKGNFKIEAQLTGIGKIYISDYMSWWSARNYCLAHGKKLWNIDNNPLMCFDDDIMFPPNGDGYCNKNVTGKNLTNADAERSDIMKELLSIFGGWHFVWTDTIYDECQASAVTLNFGYIGPRHRSMNSSTHGYALCID